MVNNVLNVVITTFCNVISNWVATEHVYVCLSISLLWILRVECKPMNNTNKCILWGYTRSKLLVEKYYNSMFMYFVLKSLNGCVYGTEFIGPYCL